MNPATPAVHLLSENRANAPAAGRQLNVGQVLNARVVSAGPGGSVVLNVAGQRIAAHALMPLAAGQELRLRVQGTGPETVLRVLDAGRGGAQVPAGERLLTVSTPATSARGGGGGAAATAGQAARGDGASPVRGQPLMLEVAGTHGLTHGRTVQARVLSAPGAGRALLDVGGQAVAVRVPGSQDAGALGLAPGRMLRVQIHADAAGTRLEVRPDPAGARTVATDPLMAAQVMRAALPRQQPLAQAFAAIVRVLQDPRLHADPQLRGLRQELGALIRSLPDRRDAGDAARLAAMVRASGLFHEASAAAGPDRGAGGARTDGAGVADTKGRLHSATQALAMAARDAPPAATASLLESADEALRGALARIETQQAGSVRSAGAGDVQAWYFDVPLAGEHGVDDLRLRLARERRGQGEEATSVWTAELIIHPSGGAALHARLSLAPDGVVTVLTTEDGALHRALEGQASQLRGLYSRAGLASATIQCRCAPVPDLDPPVTAAGLVSEQA